MNFPINKSFPTDKSFLRQSECSQNLRLLQGLKHSFEAILEATSRTNPDPTKANFTEVLDGATNTTDEDCEGCWMRGSEDVLAVQDMDDWRDIRRIAEASKTDEVPSV